MIDQEKIHNQCFSEDKKERIRALEQLKNFFSSMPDKQQAWNDLIKLISDKDSNVRSRATKAFNSVFSHMPNKQQAWNDLIKLTIDEDSDVRSRATKALGSAFSRMPNKQQAWNDIHRLTFDEESGVRSSAAEALGSAFSQVPDKQQAWNRLHILTSDEDSNVRSSAAEALGSAFSQMPDKQQAWNDLIKLTIDEDSDVRSTYTKALDSAFLQMPDKQQAWNDLRILTEDPDSNMRSSAAEALGSVFSQVPDKQQAWNRLHILTSDEDSNVRSSAAEALGSAFSQMPDKQQAWNDLIKLTIDEESYVRSRAARALDSAFLQMPDKQQAWNDLRILTEDPDSNVRSRAAEALGSVFSQVLDKQQAWNDLIKLTIDEDSYVRYWAARALDSAFSQMPDKQQVWNDIRRLASDKDNDVRSRAAYAIGSAFSQVPDKQQAWNELRILTFDKNSNVRSSAAESLGYVFSEVPNKKQAWDNLLRMRNDANNGVSSRAFDALSSAFYYMPFSIFMEEIQLKVEKAYPIDLGRGIIRLDPTTLLKLQLSPGDIVEIRGRKKTTAKVWRSDREDWDQGLVRIDNFIRQNAGVSIGEKVTIRKVEAPEAKKLILALPESMMQGGPFQFGEHANEIIKRYILKRPVLRGDIIPIINSMSQPMTESLTTSQVIPLVAVETEPSNTIVIITETTAIELLNKKEVQVQKNVKDFNNVALKINDGEKLITTVRELIFDHDYRNARILLENVVRLQGYKKLIKEEFSFLYEFKDNIEKDKEPGKEKKELLKWQIFLWSILAEKNKFPLKENVNNTIVESEINTDLKITDHETKDELINDDYGKKFQSSKLTPQEKGEILEKGILELFSEFFIIADEEKELPLTKLRQQKKGYQFGFDISLECTVKEYRNVKCHIECKNLSKSVIEQKDIADKILATQIHYSGIIDNWILISPNADPSNDLEDFVTKWNEDKKDEFNIQIWSPNNNIEEFFGLNPKIYDLFSFKPKKSEEHPEKWTPEKRKEVFEKWAKKLMPVNRLPKEWEIYVKQPFRMCLRGENAETLDTLYRNHVQIECMDERKNPLNKSMEQCVREWMDDPETSLMFILGEFGDGKSVFTYVLSRKLAEEYVRNPSDGWIPIRFSLSDYYNSRNSQEFLKRRLELFDSNLGNWDMVKNKKKLLIILDGFDEISKKLDPGSVKRNIEALVACCEEFKDLKIIVTSRTHFLEKQKDKKRLLQRLPQHCMYYLAPVNRKIINQHLEDFARSPEDKIKLRNIRRLHDPIGLASKPLFLQMIKVALPKLPDNDLNEVILYDTYIRQSLDRKKHMLDDKEMNVLPEEIYLNLTQLLEIVALKLQVSEKEYLSLAEEFSDHRDQNLASYLWKTSDSNETLDDSHGYDDTDIADATARVGIRSLLARVKVNDENIKWPVDFCHRSMREFFVAKAICSTLSKDKEKAKELLHQLPLNHEIIYFTSELMKHSTDKLLYEKLLLKIISESKNPFSIADNGSGNVATLLYRLKNELPGDDWSKLNLDFADLSGANLSGKNFSSTSLRYSNLDNVNFEKANFADCDLTGVRIEETTSVLAITPNPAGDKIIVAYGDNTIREWDISQSSRIKNRIIGKNETGKINQMVTFNGLGLCALTNNEVIFYEVNKEKNLEQKSHFKTKPEYKFVSVQHDSILLLKVKDNVTKELLLVDHNSQILYSKKVENCLICNNIGQKAFFIANEKSIVIALKDGENEITSLFEVSNLTSLSAMLSKEKEVYLLACGTKKGEIFVWSLSVKDGQVNHKLLLSRQIHDGIVSSIVFLDDSRIITGGLDRKVVIVGYEGYSKEIKDIQEQVLHLTVKCEGMIINGLKTEKERKMMENLIFKAKKVESNY